MLDILVIDDEPSIRMPLGHALRARGHRVAVAADGAEAMSRLDSQVFSLVVSDVKLPRVDGFTILRRLRKESPATDVVLMTAFGTIADAVAAMKERAIDYVTKPFDLQEMVMVVDRIDERRRLVRELEEARAQLAARRSSDHLVGCSPQIAQLREQVAAIADSAAAVLLTGESGTGKELVARMIHDRSPRRDKAFVAVNCAAIPASLIEAELFGHERGAFTGAFKRRAGRFKAADGGTLFLDEIGEMPAELQPKILRVLQEGTFEPIGTNTPMQVDVRVISATNRDLKAGLADGGFRKDLYYRIRVFDLRVPAAAGAAGRSAAAGGAVPVRVHHPGRPPAHAVAGRLGGAGALSVSRQRARAEARHPARHHPGARIGHRPAPPARGHPGRRAVRGAVRGAPAGDGPRAVRAGVHSSHAEAGRRRAQAGGGDAGHQPQESVEEDVEIRNPVKPAPAGQAEQTSRRLSVTLLESYALYCADEALSVVRHDVLNRITAFGALSYELRQALPHKGEGGDVARQRLEDLNRQVGLLTEVVGRRLAQPLDLRAGSLLGGCPGDGRRAGAGAGDGRPSPRACGRRSPLASCRCCCWWP